ncbi:3-phosphoserine/phosphohydroxythreonine transaminase, partial [bacterium]|nr:3-phosphoserine/phosphohydroxythreonine transaminase [bacterium]
IYVGGGASTQFLSVPYNLMEKKSAYLDTGSWATAAIKEAKLFGEVAVVASSSDKKYSYIPKEYTIPTDADYFHITSNNTIEGTEIRKDMDCPVKLVADMSSDIFSRPVDVSKYAVIYGGAQKNLAPAGVTFALIKEDVLGKVSRPLPTMIDWRTHIKKDSLYNTPPVFAVFAALKTMEWIKAEGGVKAMEKRAIERANLLYGEIERNKLFVSNVPEEDRSRMNICFVLKPEYAELEEEFISFSKSKGMVGIKGHRSVGGFRASCYNALPIESVAALVDCMKEFEAKH